MNKKVIWEIIVFLASILCLIGAITEDELLVQMAIYNILIALWSRDDG